MNMEKNMKMKKIIYIDLDCTLVDFQSGIDRTPAEELAKYECDEKGKQHYDDIPGIFSKMGEMPGARDAFQFLAEHFDVYILSTAPWNNPSAWSDKLCWVKTHLGEPAYKRLILSHHKDLLRGDYLIDDSLKNGVDKFQGTHIHFGHDKFPDWPAVIDYFKNLLDS